MLYSSYQAQHYKPLPIRTPSLILFILLSLILVVSIETAFHTLPRAVGPGLISTTLNTTRSSIDTALLGRRGPPGSPDGADASKSPCACGNPPPWCYGDRVPQPTKKTPIVVSDSETAGSSAIQQSTTPPTPSETALYLSGNLSSSLTTPSASLIPRAAHGTSTTIVQHRAPQPQSKPSHPAEPPQYQYWTISNGLYFVASYLPVLTAVVFSALWCIVDNSIKRMEPFYQLARPTGAKGTRSLTMKSGTSGMGIGLTAYHALSFGHWTVALSSAISFLVMLIVPLSSEMIFINTKASCTPVSHRVTHCFGKLQVSKNIARAIEGLLVCAAVLCASIVWMMRDRLSGVYADPSSIASLATLLQNEDMLQELRRLDPQISDEELAKCFADKRFRIGHFRNQDGHDGYGFTVCKVGVSSRDDPKLEQKVFSFDSSSTDEKLSSARQHPVARGSLWLHPASITAFALALIGIMTLAAYYHFRGEDSNFEKFMNSQGFGVSFLMTAMGVLVKSCWANIEEEIRTLEPYRNLSLRPFPARDTILVKSKSHPIVALTSAIFSFRPFLALIAFDTILAEILTVVLPSVPYKGESIYIAYASSAILTISIIAFMLASLVWVIVRDPRALALPRRPDTIAAALLYLCGGRMVKDFQGMAIVEEKLRDRELVRMEKNYWLGKVVGVDGIERVGIEAKDEVQG